MDAHDAHVDRDGCGANAAPYVLGALTNEEHDAFVRHLESCVVCREEIAALQVVANALPAAAPQMRAPKELKQQILSSVHEDARQRREQQQRATRSARAAERSGSQVLPWLRWRPSLVAALGVTVAALIVVAAFAFASGAGKDKTHVFRAEVLPHGASASLRVSGSQAQLRVADMPQSAPGHVYEVWIKRSTSGRPLPTDALFTVDAAGAATVAVPGSVSGVKEIMVTAEPVGGSRVPTLPVLIDAHLS
jgi:anti-sigma-K factor RskA